MFIELTEFLRCPEPHDQMHLVLAPTAMVGRSVVEGLVGCPVCRREYAIRNGVMIVGDLPSRPGPVEATGPAGELCDKVMALLGLAGPGGYVVLIGSAAALAPDLAARMKGIHFVGINAPEGVTASPALSLLEHPSCLPLRPSMARGVVLGAEGPAPWMAEAERVVLEGLRVVVLRDDVPPSALEPLAAGGGLWVGEKPRRR